MSYPFRTRDRPLCPIAFRSHPLLSPPAALQCSIEPLNTFPVDALRLLGRISIFSRYYTLESFTSKTHEKKVQSPAALLSDKYQASKAFSTPISARSGNGIDNARILKSRQNAPLETFNPLLRSTRAAGNDQVLSLRSTPLQYATDLRCLFSTT